MIAKKEIFDFYKESPLSTRLYIRLKFIINPIIKVEPHVPKSGKIVDLGCGRGLFACILRLGSGEREIRGFDLDETKIKAAVANSEKTSFLRFEKGDIVNMLYPEADAFVLFDVLYLIPYRDQETILRKCHSALRRDGVLIIKDMDTRPRGKYVWNYLQETIVVNLAGFTLGDKFYFRNREDFLRILDQTGFRVKCLRMDKGYWYPHILYVCEKIG